MALGAASLSGETVDAQYLEALTETMAKSVEASETSEFFVSNAAVADASSVNFWILDSGGIGFLREIEDEWAFDTTNAAVSHTIGVSTADTGIPMLAGRYHSNYDGLISGICEVRETQSGKKLTSFLGNPNSVIFTPGVSMANNTKIRSAKYGSMSYTSQKGIWHDIDKLSLSYRF